MRPPWPARRRPRGWGTRRGKRLRRGRAGPRHTAWRAAHLCRAAACHCGAGRPCPAAGRRPAAQRRAATGQPPWPARSTMLVAVRGRCPGSGLRPRGQRRPDATQRLGVVSQFRAHGRGEREVFRGGGRIPAAGEGKAEAEVSVVVTRDRLHVLPEVVRRLSVTAGIELCPGQGLTNAACARLRLCGTFKQFGGRGGASPAQQVEPPAVPRVTVASRTLLAAVGSYRFLARLARPGPRTARVLGGGSSRVSLADGGLGIFAGTGIVAAVRCF